MGVEQIRRKNKEIGQHFFSAGALRFFKSRIGKTVYKDKYFITSEQFDYESPRMYTVRAAKPDGSIDTIGEFQQFESSQSAKNYIASLPA